LAHRRWAHPVLAGLVGLGLSLTLFGYTSRENAQHRQFRPGMEVYFDPGLYANDDFVRTLEKIPTYFWKVSAWTLGATGADPEAFFFALYLISVAGLYGIIFLLARELGGSVRAGWIAVALSLVSTHLHFYSLFAHDTLLRDRADQTLLVWPFLLGSLWLWVRGRKGWAYLLTGAAFNLNPMFSGSTAFCFLAADALGGRGKKQWKDWARCLAVYLAASAPTWIVYLWAPATSIGSREWADLLRLWYPFHYFPSSWSGAQWLYIVGHGGALAALYFVGFRGVRRRPEMMRFGAGLLILWTVYVFFSEVVPFRPFILFQSLRMDVVACLLALIAAACVFDRLLGQGPAGWAWAGLLWVVLGNPHRTFLPLPLLLPILVQWARKPNSIGRFSGWTRIYVGGVGLISLLRCGAGFQLSVLYPLESAVFMVVFAALLWKPTRGRWRLGVLGCAVLLSFLELGNSRRAERRAWAQEPMRLERLRIESWLRTNTPKEALVLAVPFYYDLRLGSRRSMVGQLIDGAALHWDPDFGPLWKVRMEDLGYLFERSERANQLIYRQRFPLLVRGNARFPLVRVWDRDRQVALLDKYRPDYVVSPFKMGGGGLNLEVVTGRFAIYSVGKSRI